MTRARGDQLTDDYLRRLDQAAHALPAQRRLELLSEIRAHIAHARAATEGGDDEVAVRNALERLGPPEEIAAAAFDGQATAPPPGHRSPGQRLYDVVTVLLLLLGGVVIPVLGWLVGVVLLWASPRWSARDKALGTLVFPLGLGAALALPLLATRSCGAVVVDGGEVRESCEGWSLPTWTGIPLLVVLGVAPVVVAVVLLRRAERAGNPAGTAA
jgi:hypothetical protein